MKKYSFRIWLETYKNVQLKIALKVEKLYLLSYKKCNCLLKSVQKLKEKVVC